jgi:hypothetical protein
MSNDGSAREQDHSLTKPIWQRIMDIGNEISVEEWQAAVPSDLSANVDCYLYRTTSC